MLALPVLHLLLHTAAAAAPGMDPVVYRGPAGVEIRSWDPRWATTDQLQAIYDELVSNGHGAELEHLASVDLLPGNGRSHWTGHIARLPDGRARLEPGARIILYARGRTHIAALAPVLAHEYGHHFTYYWFMHGTGRHPIDFRKTEWEQARDLFGEARVSGDAAHRWHPAEIMAEDYRQLFGSRRALYFPNEGKLFFPLNPGLPPARRVPPWSACIETGVRTRETLPEGRA